MPIHSEKIRSTGSATKFGFGITHQEPVPFTAQASGTFLLEMRDSRSGELLYADEKKNIITLDAGILAARLFRNSLNPSAVQSNGVTMLAVGTGATGNILAPDAPQNTQRKLNAEIARKAFASTQHRNGSGVAVAYETNILDFTTTFAEAEAVGPLNEMGLMYTPSMNPAVSNPINNGPSNYDPAINVAGKDLLVNYLTFSVVSKPANAVLTVTWRLTF